MTWFKKGLLSMFDRTNCMPDDISRFIIIIIGNKIRILSLGTPKMFFYNN